MQWKQSTEEKGVTCNPRKYGWGEGHGPFHNIWNDRPCCWNTLLKGRLIPKCWKLQGLQGACDTYKCKSPSKAPYSDLVQTNIYYMIRGRSSPFRRVHLKMLDVLWEWRKSWTKVKSSQIGRTSSVSIQVWEPIWHTFLYCQFKCHCVLKQRHYEISYSVGHDSWVNLKQLCTED